MNRSFCLIWNERLCEYVAAPESARRRGKGRSVVGAAVLAVTSLAAHALPAGSQVSAGRASIAQGGGAMTVNQQSQNLAINWSSFGIAPSESVSFLQPNASAIALNRVLGADPTQIYGRLNANGQVWILNPNGVLFGGGAQVNVGGLLASTLNISDADFLAGKRTFTGNGGTVTNQGSIGAADGGYVALLGGKVSNEGVIQARLGTAGLGAGKQVTLDFAGDKLLNLQVDEGAVNALAQNKQLIKADGGAVFLSARAANALLDTVVNNTGLIEARTIDNKNGTIRLLGGPDAGAVSVAGTLDASAPNGGDGGSVHTSGTAVKVSDDAHITTAAPAGKTGQWVIDPKNFLIAPGRGSDMTGAALSSQLNSTTVIIYSSSGKAGDNGDILVNDSVAWNSANGLILSAYNSIRVNKTISNSGTGGITLRADNGGNCVAGTLVCGTVIFAPRAGIVTGGAVNLYYNPVGSNAPADSNGNGPTYANPTDYSAYVRLTGAGLLHAFMLVNDVNQLQALNTNLGGLYALGRDVDASTTTNWNSGAGFVPIGSSSTPFFGGFDGDVHTISGLHIYRRFSDNMGLFGQSSGAITNVGVIGAAVTGSSGVGILAGSNAGTVSTSYSTGIVVNTEGSEGGLVGTNSGTVTDSHSSASVYWGATHSGPAGGLIGSNNGGSVKNSYSTGDVAGYTGVGGLIGASNGDVSNSYSTGRVFGVNFAGGLIGSNSGTVTRSHSSATVSGDRAVGGLIARNSGSVSDSYSTGAVTAAGHTVDAGGLIGSNGGSVANSYSTGSVTSTGYGGVAGLIGNNSGTVSNSYSTGAVAGAGDYSTIGGLVAINSGTVTNSYWDITTSGQSASAAGTGLTDTQMKQQSSFVGFDFVNLWDINEGVSYPFLRGQ